MSFQNKMKNMLTEYAVERDFQTALGLSEDLELEFLAQGEYNINYLIKDGEDKFVIRINLGSQMNLDNQIAYEFNALESLVPSGVTPRPFLIDDSQDKLPYGMLVMEYLSGRPLEYKKDLKKAAEIFAAIHEVETDDEDKIIRERKPLTAVWNECDQLINKYLSSELADEEIKIFLNKLRDKLYLEKEKEDDILSLLPESIVNTEVNSGNFIINEKEDEAYLVDWEKPLITTPIQDLSHFMVPTTTLWKTNFLFNQAEEEEFLHHYINARNIDISYRELLSALEVFNKFSAMRGISWSAMAWVEYQQPDRLIKNNDTFQTIESYLRRDFLEMLFPKTAKEV